MTKPMALALPEAHGEYDPIVALWMLRLAIHDEQAIREITRGIYSEELRLLLGIEPNEGDLPKQELRHLLKLRLLEFEHQNISLVDSTLALNIKMLGQMLGLAPIPQLILMFLTLSHQHSLLSSFVDYLCKITQESLLLSLSKALNISKPEIKNALRHDGELMRMKLINYNKSFSDNTLQYVVLDELREVLFIAHANVTDLMNCFIEQAPLAKLHQQDFPHMESETQLLTGYLSQMQNVGVLGINVLVYGIPGVGKTEYIRSLASSLQKTLYQVKSEDQDGNSMTRRGRLMCYQLCQRFLCQADALVLFDEIEDVFSEGMDLDSQVYMRNTAISKAWINMLLETNEVPTIWISNHVAHIDPAYLRRFDFSIEMRLPPKSVRDRMLQYYLGAFSLSSDTLTYLSQQSLTPAQLEKAAKVLQAFKTMPTQQEERVKQVVQSSMQLLEQEPTKARTGNDQYDLQYLNVDSDFKHWVKQLKPTSTVQGSICLYGAPGTGKTILAQHIAMQLDRPLHIKSASEILSPFVGMAEKNMAEMFRQAQKDGAVLLLDEADSFLMQRNSSGPNWQVTQVNEMLVQMERFEGLFICTTNLMASMDEACLRRFAFKIKFDYLHETQRWWLFKRYVSDMTEHQSLQVQKALKHMYCLTPGDYANVMRQYQMMDGKVEAEGFLFKLQLECQVKSGTQQASIGFLASSTRQ